MYEWGGRWGRFGSRDLAWSSARLPRGLRFENKQARKCLWKMDLIKAPKEASADCREQILFPQCSK